MFLDGLPTSGGNEVRPFLAKSLPYEDIKEGAAGSGPAFRLWCWKASALRDLQTAVSRYGKFDLDLQGCLPGSLYCENPIRNQAGIGSLLIHKQGTFTCTIAMCDIGRATLV